MGAAQQLMAAGAPSDPSFEFVQLLMHGDGANNSTTFTDSSSAARTMTAAASAKISTAQSVFGGASMDFSAAGDEARISSSAAAALSASGDFSLEFRLRMTSTAAGIYFLIADGNNSDLYVYTTSSGKIGGFLLGNVRSDLASISSNTWYAICIDRSGSTVKYFVDGAVVDTSTSSTSMGTSAQWFIGANPAFSGANTGGRCFIDELRLTIGASRHQAAYTVDAAPFPDS